MVLAALGRSAIDRDDEAAIRRDVHVEAVKDRLGHRGCGVIVHQRVIDGRRNSAAGLAANFVFAAMRDRNGAIDEIGAVAGPARAGHVAAKPVVRRGHEARRLREVGIAVRRAHRVVEQIFLDHRLKAVALIARRPGSGVVPQQGDNLADPLHLGAGEQRHGCVLGLALGRSCEGVFGHIQLQFTPLPLRERIRRLGASAPSRSWKGGQRSAASAPLSKLR